jgi:hypothetical protein
MFTSTSDIHVSNYSYNHRGIYIEYTVKGDPREYTYITSREDGETLMEEFGNEPEDDLSQMDAILLVSKHLSDKRQGKVQSLVSADELLNKMADAVCTDLLNRYNRKPDLSETIHRNY